MYKSIFLSLINICNLFLIKPATNITSVVVWWLFQKFLLTWFNDYFLWLPIYLLSINQIRSTHLCSWCPHWAAILNGYWDCYRTMQIQMLSKRQFRIKAIDRQCAISDKICVVLFSVQLLIWFKLNHWLRWYVYVSILIYFLILNCAFCMILFKHL